ncbi:MAG: hypothetical protein H7062_05180, partial [Candidatus Saccharimonas sp.]|nr:hypothetical protein [Planctomycetaceae bacterium]
SSSIRTVFRSSVTRASGWPVWDGEAASGEWRVTSVESVIATDDDSTASVPLATRHSPLVTPLPYICFDIEADGFLYNMVRAIVGTLIHVGRGRWSADDMRRILETGDRSAAGETAPAHGLCLMRVDYDENLTD